jgi:transcriptional regulator with XRE-family HTH domain
VNILKRLRAEADKTLEKVAEATGIDQATISQLENDRRKARYNTLYKLAKYYGRDVDDEEFKGLLDDGAERGRRGGLATQLKKEGPVTAG